MSHQDASDCARMSIKSQGDFHDGLRKMQNHIDDGMTPLLYRPRTGPVKFSTAECTLLECPERPALWLRTETVSDRQWHRGTHSSGRSAPSVQCLDGCGPFITW